MKVEVSLLILRLKEKIWLLYDSAWQQAGPLSTTFLFIRQLYCVRFWSKNFTGKSKCIVLVYPPHSVNLIDFLLVFIVTQNQDA